MIEEVDQARDDSHPNPKARSQEEEPHTSEVHDQVERQQEGIVEQQTKQSVEAEKKSIQLEKHKNLLQQSNNSSSHSSSLLSCSLSNGASGVYH